MLLRGLAAKPGDAALLFDYAMSANNRGHFIEALARWDVALKAAPDDPICWCGVAANARASDAYDRAKSTIDEALAMFPGNKSVLAEAARIAMGRVNFEQALAFWTEVLRGDAPHSDWIFGEADTLLRMGRLTDAAIAIDRFAARDPSHLGVDVLRKAIRGAASSASDDLPVPLELALEVDETPIAPGDIMGNFESLGDNCEFGLAQRYSNIEPLGLFRFSASSTDNMIAVLARRLSDYGEEGDLEIFLDGGCFDCRSRRYRDFTYHTEVRSSVSTAEKLLPRELKKVAYLKKRLVADLTSGEKIFVRKGGSFERAIALFRIMRTYGSATLLWVETADELHPAGHVERIEDGLLKGYMTRLAPYGEAPDMDLTCWLDVCCNALAFWKGEGAARLRLTVERSVLLRTGFFWAFTDKCWATDVPTPLFPTWTFQRLTLAEDTSRDNSCVALRYVDHECAPRALLVFSVWIWIPADFQGSFIHVCFINSTAWMVSRAALERRETWQRVWASTRLDKGQVNASLGLCVTGLRGDTIFLGPWRLEEGSVPRAWDLETNVYQRGTREPRELISLR